MAKETPMTAALTQGVVAEVLKGAERAVFDRHWSALAVAVGIPPEAGVKAGEFAIQLDRTLKHIGFDPADNATSNEWYKAAIERAPGDVTKNVNLQMEIFAYESPGHALLASAALDTIFEGHRLGEALRPSTAPPLDTARQVIDRIEKSLVFQGERPADEIDLGPARDPMQWGTDTTFERPSADDIEAQAQRELAAELADEREALSAGRFDDEIDLGPAREPREWDTDGMPEHPSADDIEAQARRELAAELADEAMHRAGQEQDRDRANPADEERTISPVFEREATADAGRTGADAAPEPEPAHTRAGDAVKTADADDKPKPVFSVQKGDVPDALRSRYLIEPDKLGGDVSFYTDAKSMNPAFRDAGAKLVTRETNNEVVRDMVATAVHRGWGEIKVTGEPEFRRQVWIEASLKGLEVTGFKPTERDRQEMEKLLDARDARTIEPVRDRSQTNDTENRQEGPNPSRGAADAAPPAPQRPDYDKGVSGVLVETGSAPYNNDKANEPSAYVTLETAPGQRLQIWGVGLPDAIQRSGVEIGDKVTVRRDGTEMVQKTVQARDKATGETRPEVRDVPRNRWEVTADRFREAAPAEAARDPQLREAQATLKVIEATLSERVSDKGLREKLMAVAKDHIASKIALGGSFKEARVRETMRKDPTPRNVRQASRTTAKTDEKKRSSEARSAKATSTRQAKAENKKQDQGKVRKNPERSRSR